MMPASETVRRCRDPVPIDLMETRGAHRRTAYAEGLYARVITHLGLPYILQYLSMYHTIPFKQDMIQYGALLKKHRLEGCNEEENSTPVRPDETQ